MEKLDAANVERWLEWARADAEARGVEGLPALIEALAGATRALREADWNLAPDAAVAAPSIGSAVAVTDAHRMPVPAPGPSGGGHESGRPSDDARHRFSAPGQRQDPVSQSDLPSEMQSITALLPRLVNGEVSARDLVDACLERIGGANARLNAVITTLAVNARDEAAQADADRAAGKIRGPLHGIPVTLKDLIDLEGTPTTAASTVRCGLGTPGNATVAKRLINAGAIIIGKTNLHEFAFGTTSEDSAFGSVRHPVDTSRSPGGSSGGSAAAIRAGMCVASIGSDTGGSIRIPAAVCGLVGLKPTFGEVPTDGVVPLAWSLDHLGPLARCVEDAWLIWEVISGRASPLDRARQVPQTAALRLAVVEPYFTDLLEDGIREAFQNAVEGLGQAGVRISKGEIPHASLTGPVYLHTVMPEATAFHGPTLERRPHDYTAPVRNRLEMGRYILAEDYVRAMRGREVLAREVDRLLETADAIVLPAVPMAAPHIGQSAMMIGGRRELVRNVTLRLTQLFNLTGHPAITIPIGDAEPGFPAGLQLVGRRDATDTLLAVALATERIVDNFRHTPHA